ncbi:hypothetical protein B0T25DRAFT_559972 [Lasiosphaeria hispida]|uniref:RRM domain-containing protein n=1 Tax=Lasiosphaeria hispida TaxID=260671 RepID=A0AAJ0H7M8_9PEZI|nr:hypothetical protein B0T25DRAFT_559972 [Lasiosphaeria hispida]
MASRSRSPVPVPREPRLRSRSPTRSPTPRPELSRSPSMDPRDAPDRGSRSPRRNGRYRSRSYSRDRSWSRSRSRSRSASLSEPPRSTKVVVERLTKNVKEEHLREIFGQYGEIKDLDLPLNRQCTLLT